MDTRTHATLVDATELEPAATSMIVTRATLERGLRDGSLDLPVSVEGEDLQVTISLGDLQALLREATGDGITVAVQRGDVEVHGLRERLVLIAVVAAATTGVATPIARAADAPAPGAQAAVTQQDSALRAEIAAALNVDPGDRRVDIAIVEAQLNGTLKPSTPAAATPPENAPARAPAPVGPAPKYDPTAERLELMKQEMDKAGLTDEMIRNGYYKETPFTFAGRPGVLIEGLVRTPEGPVSVQGAAFTQKDGTVQQSVLTTNLATGVQSATEGVRDLDGRVTITFDKRLSGDSSSGDGAKDAPSSSGADTDNGTTLRSTSFTQDGKTYTSTDVRYKDGTTVNTSSSSSDQGTTTDTTVSDSDGHVIYQNTTKTDSDGNVTKSDSGGSEPDSTNTTGTGGDDSDSGTTPSNDDSGTATAMTSEDGSVAAVSLRPLGPTKLDQLGHPVGGDLGGGATVERDDKGQPILRDRPIVGDPSGEPETAVDGTIHVVAAAGPEYGPDGRPTVDTSDGPPSNDPYGPISNRP